MNPSVTVIGGGISGLAASVFLAKEGLRVGLYEASPRLGGRTYSYFDNQLGGKIDNGQHIMASWYQNTFDYLKIIGSYDMLYFQKQMEVSFVNLNGESFVLKASKLPPPFHLLKGLMDFKALSSGDRIAAIKLINSIKSGKINESDLKKLNVNELFLISGQTEKLNEYFWKPFIIAVFNAAPENTSAYMFAEIIKTGFLQKGGSNLVFPHVFLSELLVEPAVEFLKNNNGSTSINCKVEQLNISNNRLTSVIIKDNSEIESDYYISAVPFFSFDNLLKRSDFLNGKQGLSPSPIVNIHFKFESDITSVISKRFYGLLESVIQWVFRVKNDQLCVVISNAKVVAEMDNKKIIELCMEELFSSFPKLKNINIAGERVIKEMRATFVPDKESLNKRPGCKTSIENFFIAGDWTNTGLPATIEGAVKSAKLCTTEILKSMSKN